MSDQQATGSRITFEEGYEELKTIVARLGEEDVSVHEMFEGFRRGKGLERSLRQYLTEREGELTEIEQGHNLPRFEIVAPSEPSARSRDMHDTARPTVDVARADTSDDDIPF